MFCRYKLLYVFFIDILKNVSTVFEHIMKVSGVQNFQAQKSLWISMDFSSLKGDFQNMDKIIQNILRNIFFCVLQQKESHMSLQKQNLNFLRELFL